MEGENVRYLSILKHYRPTINLSTAHRRLYASCNEIASASSMFFSLLFGLGLADRFLGAEETRGSDDSNENRQHHGVVYAQTTSWEERSKLEIIIQS